MKRFWLVIILSLALILLPTSPAVALTTQDVEVTATPAYLEIANAPATYTFSGFVAAGTNYPTPQGTFTVTNGSTVTCNVTVGTNATAAYSHEGGTEWTLSATNATAADTMGMTSSNNTNLFGTIIKFVAPNILYQDLETGVNFQWEFMLSTPTAFSNGYGKHISIRLTAQIP